MRWLSSLIAMLGIAAPLSASAEIDPLTHFLDGLHAYSASFEQVVSDAGGQETERAEGTLLIERPGHFRWEYRKPYPQLIVADGTELFMYDPDLEQVTVRAMDDSLSRTPALLLTGDRPIAENFATGPADMHDGLLWMDLRPRGDDADFDTIWVGFDAAGELVAMKIRDGFGQITHLFFHDGRRDPPIPADAFVFIPPPGTDVIRSPARP